MPLILIGLALVVLAFVVLKDRIMARLSFGIGIIAFGFGLLFYIR